MRKTLAAGLAALSFGGAIAATALPSAAEARDWRGGYYGGDWDRHHHHNNSTGTAIVAGIAGLAIGAALADSSHSRSYYNGGYYDRGYYDRGYGYYGSGYGSYGYGYAPGYYDYGYQPYAMCESRRWVWDPYIGRRVLIRSRYAC